MVNSMNKRAGSEMWWIIIGAVIALIVLIVLLVLFTGKTRGLEGGLTDCEGKGGVCVSNGDCPSGTLETSTFTCGKDPDGESEGQLCCVGIAKKCTSANLAADCGNANEWECIEEYCYAK
ncbi:hypothetical protein HYX13_02295 [Candidatus Woesearchaeota archaeon]|nr:hypothetical protein [Candidatus Woesearchaeota archaeon]